MQSNLMLLFFPEWEHVVVVYSNSRWESVKNDGWFSGCNVSSGAHFTSKLLNKKNLPAVKYDVFIMTHKFISILLQLKCIKSIWLNVIIGDLKRREESSWCLQQSSFFIIFIHVEIPSQLHKLGDRRVGYLTTWIMRCKHLAPLLTLSRRIKLT